MSEVGVLEKEQLEVAQETELELVNKGVVVVSSDEEDIDEEIEDFEPDEDSTFGDESDNENEEFAEDFLPEDLEQEEEDEDLLEDFEPDEE